jgi:molybdate transport system substrate-binding protein
VLRALVAAAFLASALASCAPAASIRVAAPTPAAGVATAPLVVLAAADLQYALPEIAQLYEAETGRKVTISLGSTGTFATQIQNGAPADVFFAADSSFMDDLEKADLLAEKTRQLYATGRIVVTYAKGAAEARTLEDLTKPELKKIAIANPEHAPYGRAAQEALQKAGVWDKVQPKLVLGENIAQTAQLIRTGNADAGIIALSVALGQPGTPYALVDASLHEPLAQQVAVLKASKQVDAAKEFIAFVNGPQGRPVMKKYGFLLPGE